MEKRVGIFKMAPAALDNQFRSLMFIVDVLSGTGFIEFSIKAETKLRPTAWKKKKKKLAWPLNTCFWSVTCRIFCFVLLWLFFGGRGGAGRGVFWTEKL